ncbi:MAG: hypothetical protein J6C23_05655 [Clostridia bacterium]|nr:hypothetical protein [Clostridia bacterium]
MDEKIKISLPKSVLETLRKDCSDFKILKENGQTNVNLFINTLIVNYYESFSANEESLHNEIRKSLNLVPDRYKESVFNDVIKIFERKNEISGMKKETATFSFKPTKISDKAISFIENIVLQHESISSFYRRMFSSYVQKTKNEREKIIHKENYTTITKAIKTGIKVCIETNKNTILPCVSIFSISPAKDELFNYVLGFDGKNNVTIRLASIKHVSLLSTKAEIPEIYLSDKLNVRLSTLCIQATTNQLRFNLQIKAK